MGAQKATLEPAPSGGFALFRLVEDGENGRMEHLVSVDLQWPADIGENFRQNLVRAASAAMAEAANTSAPADLH